MKKSKPKITVITPTYYRPDLLKRTILSIQNQTFKDYEHIIVGDHCPYAEKVYKLFKDDKRIRFFKNPNPHVKNAGSVGKNIGYEKAKSRFICYCDDDNVYLKNHLEVMYRELSKNTNDIVYTKYYHVPLGNGDGIIEKLCQRELYDYSGYDHVGNTDNLNMGHTVDALIKCGGWKSDSPGKRDGEDTELMKRFENILGNRTIRVDDITCIYYARAACIIDDNQYNNSLKKMKKEQIYVYNK